MADKTIPVFHTNADGDRIQVAWATPDDGTGVRSLNILAGYENVSLSELEFGDKSDTKLDPATTQSPVRTYEESVGQDFVDIDGNVVEPADPEVHWAPDAVVPDALVTIPEELASFEEPSEEEADDDLEGDPEWDALVAEENAKDDDKS